MDKAEFYSENNDVQYSDAEYVIENYSKLIKWNSGKNNLILDVGCGDGKVTIQLLLPKLPFDYGKIIGVDLSENMIKFAGKAHKNENSIEFRVMDIISKISIKNYFNHIFSFYCLHWVQDQNKAFNNMFTMLKPGGDLLLTFLITNPIYNIYEIMAKKAKWSIIMQDYLKYISPYHNCKNPQKKIEDTLKNVGFTEIYCKIEKRSYIYGDLDKMRCNIVAVNPFLNQIGTDEIDHFLDDYLEEARKIPDVFIEKCTKTNKEIIKFYYSLGVVYGCKPL